MDRAGAVLDGFSMRDTAQAAISLARFRDPKRMARWQPLVRALQDRVRAGMAEMNPKVCCVACLLCRVCVVFIV